MEGSVALATQPITTTHDDNAVERPIPYHGQFLNIPTEIRTMIYSYCIEGEQEDIREYSGNHSNAIKSDFCTPLLKARPPSLIRVCKQTREEYIPIYFRETCFRVYVDITRSVPSGNRTTYPLDADRVKLDSTTSSWLRSINQIQHNGFFRNLQFRITHEGGAAVGANLNLAYNAQESRYEAAFVVDDGWPPIQGADLSFATYDRVRIMPNHAWCYVKRSSEEHTQEWIDWGEVEMLRHKFRCLSGVTRTIFCGRAQTGES